MLRQYWFIGANRCAIAIAAVIASASGACTSAAPIPPAPVPETAAFIARLGSDTVAIERFTRTGNRIEGDVLMRSPNTRIAHYVVDLGPDGMPVRAEYTMRRPDGSLIPNAPRSATMTIGAETVESSVLRDTVVTRRVAARNALPSIPLSYAMPELALRHLVASPRDTMDIVTVSFGASAASVFPTKLMRPDSARITWFGWPQYVRIDRAGRILGLDASATTFKVRVDRLPNADIAALASMFAAAEQGGRGFTMSVRDTTHARIGRAHLMVDYGRPLRRGRTIFGGVVPFDTIWRTGANAATQLRTDADLVIGGVNIPAGTYTLWTVPRETGAWKLVINKQVGQWGTIYDPQQDLARIDMRTETVATPVERFTIAIEPAGSGGILSVAWDRTRASVPFSVR